MYSDRGKPNGKNPVVDGETTRCRLCESVFHYDRNCPESQSAMIVEDVTNEKVESVDVVLLNETVETKFEVHG